MSQHDPLAEQIRQAIERHGQSAVARALGVSRTGLASYVAGCGAHATSVVIRLMAPALDRLEQEPAAK